MDEKKFRRLLTTRRDDLLSVEDAAEEAAKIVELDQTRVGRVSRMDALQNQAMMLEINRRRERELALIQDALQRLETGEYGWCAECGKAIAEPRLEVDLTATLCIECARKKETGEGAPEP